MEKMKQNAEDKYSSEQYKTEQDVKKPLKLEFIQHVLDIFKDLKVEDFKVERNGFFEYNETTITFKVNGLVNKIFIGLSFRTGKILLELNADRKIQIRFPGKIPRTAKTFQKNIRDSIKCCNLYDINAVEKYKQKCREKGATAYGFHMERLREGEIFLSDIVFFKLNGEMLTRTEIKN